MLALQTGMGKSIILILAEEPNLKMKQIYVRVLRHQQRAFSYQALHKKIKGLMEEGILSRQFDSYFLNPSWLDQLDNFIQVTRHKYESTEQNLNEGAPIQEIRDYFKNKYCNQGANIR